MRTIKLSMLLAAMLTVGFNTVKAQTADEIMEKHAKATGGPEAWNKVKTMKISGNLSLQGMEIPMTTVMVMGTALRADYTYMGMSGFQIVTKNGGWSLQPGQTKLDTLKGQMLTMVQKQIDMKDRQMFDYKSDGSKISLEGKDSVNDVPCYKIKIIDKEGNESLSYFDINTYYLLRTESKIKIEDQEQEIAVTYKDYKKLPEGIVMAMSVNNGMYEQIFKTVDINQPVDDKIFIPTPPAATGK